MRIAASYPMKRLLLAGCFASFATGASAQYCTVQDPTGTPLNVRSSPNGAIIGALHNGTTVHVLNSAVDAGGRAWAYVQPQGPGRVGWVFGAYLNCHR